MSSRPARVSKVKKTNVTADSTPTRTGDYSILQLSLPPASPAYPHTATHYLYIRPYFQKDLLSAETASNDDTTALFVANIPVAATESSIRTLFKKAALGNVVVEHVEFEDEIAQRRGLEGLSIDTATLTEPALRSKKRKRHPVGEEEASTAETEKKRREVEAQIALPKVVENRIHKSGSSAVVTLVDKASRDTAWKSVQRCARNRTSVTYEPDCLLGSERYKVHHKNTYPSRAVLQSSVDSYLALFDAHETREQRKATRLRSQPDEDGFITVTRGGRNNPVAQDAVKSRLEEKEKGKRERVGKDFYRFQNREVRKEREDALRKKFEQDKQRLQDMQGERKRLR